MREFYALSSSQETDVMEEQTVGNISESLVTPQSQQGQILPLQIILLNSPSGQYVGTPLVVTPTTEKLASISDPSSTESASPSLIAALQSTLSPQTSKRMLVIPGARKHKKVITQETEQSESSHYRRWLTSRICHGIVIGIILLLTISTLLTLTPLGKGQNPFSLVGGISNWFHVDQLSWQVQAHAETLSSFQNYAPPPPMILPKSQYVAIAEQDAVSAGISPEYFVRQINQESGFNPNAVSPAGAVGIAQFLPGTAAGLGIDPWDPISALRGAAHLMASYANSYGGDYAKALAAYNGGTGTVKYAVNTCGANWMNCLPYQTRNYIYVIMGI